MTRMRNGIWVLAALVVVVVIGGCVGRMKSAEHTYDAAESPMAASPEMMRADESYEADDGSAGGGMSAMDFISTAAETGEISRHVIYTADMSLWVKDVEASVTQVEAQVDEMGGWLQSKDAQVDYRDQPTCTIQIRVPRDKFRSTMANLRQMGEVRSERILPKDVTGQLNDLDARLKNLRREEEVVAALFEREGKISDVLEVERELARVRGEIERIEAALRTMAESVAFSSISVALSLEPAVIVQQISKWSIGDHVLNAWRTLLAILRAVVTALIYTVICVGPFALVVWLIVKLIIGRARKRKLAPPPLVQTVEQAAAPAEPTSESTGPEA
ncbi:MAG TPA: DUF4349 domain-containing protein [Armatimonadota bacterium]|nr:DUF4349 domain-containing protein [Armatimonadota bacterium]